MSLTKVVTTHNCYEAEHVEAGTDQNRFLNFVSSDARLQAERVEFIYFFSPEN